MFITVLIIVLAVLFFFTMIRIFFHEDRDCHDWTRRQRIHFSKQTETKWKF